MSCIDWESIIGQEQGISIPKENDKIFDNLTNKESDQQSKEVVENLELEDDNFKIDNTWREETTKIHNGFEPIWVKVDRRWASWCIIEHTSQWPTMGQQIFIDFHDFVDYARIQKNCTKEELESGYLLTEEELIFLAGNPGEKSEKYNNFRKTNIQEKHLAGDWDLNICRLGGFGSRCTMRLAGGSYATFLTDVWYLNKNNDCKDRIWCRGYQNINKKKCLDCKGCSGRLLKNPRK